MVVAVIALVVATAGTATAARQIITSSSQLRNGTVTGPKIKARSVSNIRLANRAVSRSKIRDNAVGPDQLNSTVRRRLGVAPEGVGAREAIRKSGPENNAAITPVRVASLDIPPGAYVITAKTIMSPIAQEGNLLSESLDQNRTVSGHCRLDAAGDADDARAPIETPGTQTPTTLNMQLTRSIASAGTVTLTCDANKTWRASDTSIVALPVPSVTRTESTG
jgi:hypothetical protein